MRLSLLKVTGGMKDKITLKLNCLRVFFLFVLQRLKRVVIFCAEQQRKQTLVKAM